MQDLRDIHRTTIAVYEANAPAWDRQRPKHFFEKKWLDRLISGLPAGGKVLDAGCGTGRPIARHLLEQGFRVTGVDAAPAMIERARSRFPDGDWMVMDMRNLSLSERYDGIVSWDSFFHLNPTEQRSTLPLFCQHLKPGGALLLTIGDEAGEVTGIVNGQQVYHSSLAPEEYKEMVSSAGFTKIEIALRDASCGEHSVLLASAYRGNKGTRPLPPST